MILRNQHLETTTTIINMVARKLFITLTEFKTAGFWDFEIFKMPEIQPIT